MTKFAQLLLASAALLATAGQAPPVPDARSEHAAVLPFDVHLDIAEDFDRRVPATAAGATQFDLPKAARGGVKAVGIAVFAPQEAEGPAAQAKALATAEAKHAIIAGLAIRYPDRVGRALTPADVRRIAVSGRLVLVETVVNGGAFVRTLQDLDAWAAKGVAIFGFVHAGHNRLADSSRPALVRGETAAGRNGGLSPLGRAAVARLNRLGVLIDVSQLSDAAFDQVLSLSAAPVIATHSDVRARVANNRNLTDAQLDRLKANGGVIAINAFGAYLRPHDAAFEDSLIALKREFGLSDTGNATLSPELAKQYDERYHALRATEPKPTVADLVDAVDYAVKRIGIDHVALSSDFNHGGGVVGWADESEAGNVTAELVRRGYTRADIARLWSGNVLRIWQVARDRAEHPAA
jgi:microsomal dipeptidase-like Zn-dependent dipeptidase